MVKVIDTRMNTKELYGNIKIVAGLDDYSVVLYSSEELYLKSGLTLDEAIQLVLQLEPVVIDEKVHTVIIETEE